MARYHLSPKDGQPRRCSAKIKCEFADMNDGKGVAHYNNKKEAMDACSENMKKQHETFTEMKKPKKQEYLPSKSEIRKLLSLNKKVNTAKNFSMESVHREQLDGYMEELLDKGTDADYMIGVLDGSVEPRYESNVKTKTSNLHRLKPEQVDDYVDEVTNKVDYMTSTYSDEVFDMDTGVDTFELMSVNRDEMMSLIMDEMEGSYGDLDPQYRNTVEKVLDRNGVFDPNSYHISYDTHSGYYNSDLGGYVDDRSYDYRNVEPEDVSVHFYGDIDEIYQDLSRKMVGLQPSI